LFGDLKSFPQFSAKRRIKKALAFLIFPLAETRKKACRKILDPSKKNNLICKLEKKII
jgi:hypothetical protein